MEVVPRVSPSTEVEQGEAGEDTEGGDDDVLSARCLQGLVKINQEAVTGSDGGG